MVPRPLGLRPLRRRRGRALIGAGRGKQSGALTASAWPLVLLLVIAATIAPPLAASERWTKVADRGSLRVGVKTDYPPWGFICGAEAGACPAQVAGPDADLVMAGLEIDLARALGAGLADRFDTELIVELVAVTSANRLQRLSDGGVDVVIATMAATPARAQLADLLEPFYYASGVNALVRRDAGIRTMADLRGQAVCLTTGAFFNRKLVERYGILPQFYRGTRDPLIALKTGVCAAYAYDDTALKQVLLRRGWDDFAMLATSVDPHPWVVAVPSGEGGTAFGLAAAAQLDSWHASGRLLELEARWELGCSSFLLARFRDAGGELTRAPAACAEIRPVPLEASAIANEAAHVGDPTRGWGGDGYHLRQLASGFATTTVLSVGSILGALALGVGGALAGLTLPRRLVRPLGSFAIVFQTTPPLLQLYIVFFGLAPALGSLVGVRPSPLAVALLVFSLYAGVAVANLLAQTAASRGVLTAAEFRGTFPAIVDDAYAGIVAHLVNIVKAVGMASVIAVPEVVSATSSVAAARGATGWLMIALCIFYLGFVWLVLIGLQRAKGRVRGWLRPVSSTS